MSRPFKEDKKATHRIVIEHPFVNQTLGIHTLTINQLVEWWDHQERGVYVNRKWFSNGTGTLADVLSLDSWTDLDAIEAKEPCHFNPFTEGNFDSGVEPEVTQDEKDRFFIFDAWRNPNESEDGGKYVSFFVPELGVDNPFSDTPPWTFNDYDIMSKELVKGPYAYEDLLVDTLRNNANSRYVQAVLTVEGRDVFDDPSENDENIRWLGDLILLNENANESFVESLWDEIALAEDKPWDAAGLELCRDIRSSKHGCITWAGNVTFTIKNGMMDCEKTEVVKYTLYLDSYEGADQTELRSALRVPLIAQTPTDVANRPVSQGIDGLHTVVDPKDITNNVAAPINLKFNPVLNRFESGTEQTPAILTTDIAAAVRNTDILEALATVTPENIANGEYPQFVQWGEAIPLQILNSNPHIWSAPLLYDEDKRKCLEDDEAAQKVKLKVANIFPRTWASGQAVMLSRFHNVWLPMDPGREDEPTPEGAEFLGNWDFSYFMTNAEFYFRNFHEGPPTAWPNQFLYQEYESYFHNKFYSQYLDDIGIPNAVSDPEIEPKYWGYKQITSWDFMGRHMGGTRHDSGNAIAATVYGQTTWDQVYNNQDAGLDGYYEAGISNPFFGCVFPDGYDVDEVLDRQERFMGGTETQTTQSNPLGTLIFTPEFDKKIVDDKNINIEFGVYETGENNGIRKGVFGSTLFTHLPADIGVNSTLSGTLVGDEYVQYGAPITDFRNINTFLDDDITSENYLANAGRYATLVYLEEENRLPVFNLKPNRANVIQFRPLKMETYAAGEYAGLWQEDFLKPLSMDDPTYRGAFGRRAADTVSQKYATLAEGSHPPTFSKSFLTRDGDNALLDIARQIQPGELRDTYTTDHPGGAIPTKDTELGLAYGYRDFTYRGHTGNLTPGEFVTVPWDREPWLNKPGGAIGIIGTICTIQTDSTFSLTTRNSYGLRDVIDLSSFGGNPTFVAIGELFFGMTGGNSTTTQNTNFNWGSSDRYLDFNTLMLYARVFEAWPRELTLYDSRFFGVMHFNYGAGFLTQEIEPNHYINGAEVETPAAETDYPAGTFTHYAKQHVCDVVEPTNFAGQILNETTDGQMILKMADSAYGGIFSTGGEEPSEQIRKIAQWNVNVSEDGPTTFEDGRHPRGKLLPYNYTKKTIAIGQVGDLLEAGGLLVGANDDTEDTANEAAAGSLLVSNFGTNYRSGDTFTLSNNRRVILRVPPGGVANGVILQLEIMDTGDDMEASDFMTPTTVLNTRATSPSKIVPLETNGTQFAGYFISGKIVAISKTTEKPGEVTDLLQLTPTSTTGGGDRSVVNFSKTQLVTINQDAKNYDGNQYDIFCHFHNDASMVFGDQHPGNPIVHEQYVELEVVTV